MPIGRFRSDLKRENRLEVYNQLLRDSFNSATLDGLMCRHQINIGWDGTMYDCDFNLALKLPVAKGFPQHIKDFDPALFASRRIVTGNYCFGCTAGSGVILWRCIGLRENLRQMVSLRCGNLAIEGESSSAVATYLRVKELDLIFDLGRCPMSFIGTRPRVHLPLSFRSLFWNPDLCQSTMAQRHTTG